jgi:hypothetical protein
VSPNVAISETQLLNRMKNLLQNASRILAILIVLLAALQQAAAGMVIESLDGPVTPAEIDSFKSFMAHESPPRAQTYDNAIADGVAGMECEALGMMYEVTNDPALLNRMILYADQFLALRNDPTSGRVMWTGIREPVWLTKPAGTSQAGYAGCENNDIVGHIAYCAKLILQSPQLLDKIIPDENAPAHATTYRERALTYTAQMDSIQDSYMIKRFVNPTDNRITTPTNASWKVLNESVTPWNRQMMFMNGFLRLAECHALLGDDPARIAKYDSIVQASVSWFVSGLKPHVENGHPVYDWSYGPGLGGSENLSLHAVYDVWGMNRAFLSGRYANVSRQVMTPFANTLQYVIYRGNNTFANWVSGDVSKTRNNIYPAWTLLANFNPAVYTITADANIHQGSQGRTAIVDACILWTKNARYLGAYPTTTNEPDLTALPQSSSSK